MQKADGSSGVIGVNDCDIGASPQLNKGNSLFAPTI